MRSLTCNIFVALFFRLLSLQGQGYKMRYMLIYDGIHYDALALAADKDAVESADVTAFAVGPAADLADIKARREFP